MTETPVCNYEGSDYQASFWDQGGRQYEDRAEAIALKRLLPARGRLLLELGAGAGRNTPRYTGYERIVLLDYSRTQLEQARARLGDSSRYIYVAADIYKLPFVDGLFDGATMIRTLHHMAAPSKALRQIRNVLEPGASFILEYANKRNLKAILRYWLRRQTWSPFTPEAEEFAVLNFDFHPKAIRQWLTETGFVIDKTLTVSHFRIGLLKRLAPAGWLAALDGLLQPTGALFQLTPSVFVRAVAQGETAFAAAGSFFKCPECAHSPLEEHPDTLACPACGRKYAIRDGIYDFKDALG
ncbi:MAG: methyltransferase domain-containing protein [Anaerolineales bacterium]